MSINLLPSSLQNIIQNNTLARKWEDTPHAKLGFRAIADREPFPVKIGETITKTRPGLRPAVTTPLAPAASSSLSSGLTPSTISDEQYVLSVGMIGDQAESNLVTEGVAILSKFLKDTETLQEQAYRSVDTLARNALFNSYMGGNTFLTSAASSNTIAVDDTRGFAAGMAVSVGGTLYTVAANGVVPAGSNASKVFGGISGTIQMTASVTATNGSAVVAQTAPLVIRAGARASAPGLQAGDVLTTSMLLAGVAQLRSNNIPTVDGFYNLYIDPTHATALLGDQKFVTAFQGTGNSNEFRNGAVSEVYGVRLIQNNMNPVDATASTAGSVRRAMLCGQGALVEGVFTNNGYNNAAQVSGFSHVTIANDIAHIVRPPLDALGMWVTQSWLYIGGFVVPTDIGTNANVLPTASSASLKRAIVFESL